MIVKTYDFIDFVEEFEAYDRGDWFSDEAMEELFNYYDDLGEPYELDVISICNGWSEFEDLNEYARIHMDNAEEIEKLDEYEKEEAVLKHAMLNTYAYILDNGNLLFWEY